MTSTVDEMRAAILERLDAADLALDSLSADGPRLVLEVVDASLAPQGVEATVRAEIASRIAEVLERAVAHGRKTLALQRRLAGVEGSPGDLRSVAARVADSVTKAATTLAPQLEGSALTAVNPDAWSSNSRYIEAVRGQRGALDAVPDAAEALERALTTMAEGVEQYYATLTQLVTSTTVSLLKLATTISTWETAVGGIHGITSSFVEIESGLAGMYKTALTTNQSVESMLASATRAPLVWPSAGAAPSV